MMIMKKLFLAHYKGCLKKKSKCLQGIVTNSEGIKRSEYGLQNKIHLFLIRSRLQCLIFSASAINTKSTPKLKCN